MTVAREDKALLTVRSKLPEFFDRISPSSLLIDHFHHFPTSSEELPPGALIALGKAAGGLTMGLAEILRIPPERTITVLPSGYPPPRTGYPTLFGPHPLPDNQSLQNAVLLQRFIAALPAHTPVVVAISGGSSSLVADPVPPVTLADKALITEELMHAGAPIQVINAARIHLSTIKGGGLASLLHPRPCKTYIVSDIPGASAGLVGSSPMEFVERHGPSMLETLGLWLGDRIPSSVRQALSTRHPAGAPKPPASPSPPPTVLASSETLLAVAENVFLALPGLSRLPLHRLTGELRGEAREAASVLGSQILWNAHRTSTGSVWLCAGETTVRLDAPPHGQGGRTLELGLSLALELSAVPALVLSLASDGWDGNSELAGMLARTRLFGDPRLERKGRGALLAHNTAPFLDELGMGIRTGPTGTNLNDLLMVIVFDEGETS